MKVTKWFTEEECKESINKFVKKFDDKSLTINDGLLFYKTLFGAIYTSRDEKEDEEKMELWENIESDIEEFGTMGYVIEVRDNNGKFIFKVDPDNLVIGVWEGEYEPLTDVKHSIGMDWTPACQEKIQGGNPNTTPEFFSGDCTVNGSTKLGAKPRDWIYDLFTFIDREPQT